MSLDGAVLLDHTLTAGGELPPFELPGDGEADSGTVLRIDLPDAIEPARLGLNDDERALALGLERIHVSRSSEV